MELRNGIDLAAVSRMEKSLQRESSISTRIKYRRRKNRQAQPAQTAAALWAAKEAFGKAMGTGLSGWSLPEAAVAHTPEGAPYFDLSGAAAALAAGWQLSLSLSHEGNFAIAMVTALRR